MKKREVVIILGVMIIVLFFNIKPSYAQESELEPLSTTIHYIDWEIYGSSSHQNRTAFRFCIEYVIFNPNPEEISLLLQYGCNFHTGFTCILEDESITWSDSTGCGYQMADNRTIQSGYHFERSCNLRVYFDRKNLTQIPEGFYKFWIHPYPNKPIIICKEKTITIKYGQRINYFLSIGMNLFSLFSIISLLVILYKIKKV